MHCNKTNRNLHKSLCNGNHTSKFHTKCIKIPGSFPSSLPDTHPIWAKINRPVGSVEAPYPSTVGLNGTAATYDSSLTVYGGTANVL